MHQGKNSPKCFILSFSQILYILSKQELSYRWDVTCMFLDANQSETSSVNRTQYW